MNVEYFESGRSSRRKVSTLLFMYLVVFEIVNRFTVTSYFSYSSVRIERSE